MLNHRLVGQAVLLLRLRLKGSGGTSNKAILLLQAGQRRVVLGLGALQAVWTDVRMYLPWAVMVRLQLISIMAHLMIQFLPIQIGLRVVNLIEKAAPVLTERSRIRYIRLLLCDRLQPLLMSQWDLELFPRDERVTQQLVNIGSHSRLALEATIEEVLQGS